MIQKLKTAQLKPHPENLYYFDDMEGSKWEDFLESIHTRGVIEPPIVTEEYTIVGGHQRHRACIALGITEIECDVRHYDTPQAILRDLIEMNVQQRGEITTGRIKKARITRALDEIYGVKHGGDRKSEDRKQTTNDSKALDNSEKSSSHRENLMQTAPPNGTFSKSSSPVENLIFEDHPENVSAETIRAKLGIGSAAEYSRLKNLLNLCPSLQQAVDDEKLPFRLAADVISKLPLEQQEQLAQMLPKGEKVSVKQTQEYIDAVKAYQSTIAQLENAKTKSEQEIEELRAQAEALRVEAETAQKEAEAMRAEAVEAARAIKSSQDAQLYEKMRKKAEEAKERERKEYERAEKIKSQLIKAANENDAKIAALESQINSLKASAGSATYPADYDALKRKLEEYEHKVESKHFTDQTVNYEECKNTFFAELVKSLSCMDNALINSKCYTAFDADDKLRALELIERGVNNWTKIKSYIEEASKKRVVA